MRHALLVILLTVLLKDSTGTDLLVLEKDTFNLMTFPLESLNLKIRPFNKSKLESSSSGTYPGYQAIWKIVDGKFMLNKIISTNGQETENIHKLFLANGLTVERIADCFLVNWISITYYPMTPVNDEYPLRFLAGSYDSKTDMKAVLRIEN